MADTDTLLRRLDDVSERLAAQATASVPADARTRPDAGTGERWERGQVWAHLAEFVPYWIEQANLVIRSYDGDPVAFGRTKRDAGRTGAIERDRSQPIAVLWADTHGDLEQLRAFLARLDQTAWAARGLHETLGVMSLERIVEEFLVGHLEQHAEQLEELQGGL
jgi:hypothetical protein